MIVRYCDKRGRLRLLGQNRPLVDLVPRGPMTTRKARRIRRRISASPTGIS